MPLSQQDKDVDQQPAELLTGECNTKSNRPTQEPVWPKKLYRKEPKWNPWLIFISTTWTCWANSTCKASCLTAIKSESVTSRINYIYLQLIGTVAETCVDNTSGQWVLSGKLDKNLHVAVVFMLQKCETITPRKAFATIVGYNRIRFICRGFFWNISNICFSDWLSIDFRIYFKILDISKPSIVPM